MSQDSRTQTDQHDETAHAPASESALAQAGSPSASPTLMGGGGLGAAAMHRRVLQRAARPMESGYRARMEQLFGVSFEEVRIHEGPEAEAIGAEAYAHGNDLYFAPGRYRPNTPEGDSLIGHELTHVVQQRGGTAKGAPQGKNATAITSDAGLEAEADRGGETASKGGKVEVRGVGSGIQRKGPTTPSSTNDQGNAKSGTKESISNVKALMDSDETARATKVRDILTNYDGSINTLQRLAKWLMGPSIATQYKTLTTTELVPALVAKFGDGSIIMHSGNTKTQYLHDLALNGKPSAYSKLLLSLGMLNNGGAHPNEVLQIIEDAPADQVAAIRTNVMMARIRDIAPGGTDAKAGWIRRVEGKLKVLEATAAEKALVTTDQGVKDTAHTNVITAKIDHLAGIVQSLDTRTGLDRPKAFEEMQKWAQDEPKDVRDAAVKRGSAFILAIEKMEGRNKITSLSKGDGNYLRALVAWHEPLPARFLNPNAVHDGTKHNTEHESTAKVNELNAYIGRKADKDFTGKYQHEYAPLKQKIESLTDGERDGFLFLFMTTAEQDIFKKEDVDLNVLDSLRLHAKQQVRVKLVSAGLAAEDADKLLHRFDGDSAKGQLDRTSTYKALSKLRVANYYVTHKSLLHTLSQANGNDFYNIRSDEKLVKFIVDKLGDNPVELNKAKMLLGLSSTPVVTNQVDTIKITGTREDRDSLVKTSRDDAALHPEYWSVKLGQAITDRSPTEVFSVATGAYYAAGKYVEQSKTLQPPPQPLTPESSVPAFTTKVVKLMSTAKQNKLATDSDYVHANLALLTGSYPKTDQRLEQAQFTMKNGKGLRKLGGNDAKTRSVVESAKDLEGAELLKEWSNIEDFKVLTDDKQKRDFILDVRADRREWLRDNFKNSDFVDNLKTIRAHLQTAAKDDKVFQKGVTDTGAKNDEYAQERSKGLGALDEQRNLDSGMQVGMSMNRGKGFVSRTRSHERKEASSELIGEFRSAQGTLNTDTTSKDQVTRDKVNKDNVPQLQDKEEQLDRRTASFLKSRTLMATAIKLAVAIIIAAVMAGATMGFAAIPMSTTAAIWVPFLTKGLMVLGASALKQLVNKAIEGDNFNMRAAVVAVTSQVVGAELGQLANMTDALALNHLGLLGANNYMGHGKELAQQVGSAAESDGVTVGINEGVTQLLPNILKVASVEDRQASSKALTFIPMLLAPIGEFSMSLGDIGVDSALQHEGLFSAQQQNKFGGINHDSSGKSVYTDANGTVIPKPKLSFGQMAEKMGTQTGITLGTQTLPGMGIDKGLDQLDDTLAKGQERFEGSEQENEKSQKPKPGNKDAEALKNAAALLKGPIQAGNSSLGNAKTKLEATNKFADKQWNVGQGRKDKKEALAYAETLEQQRKVSALAVKSAEDAQTAAGDTPPRGTVESLTAAYDILMLHNKALNSALALGQGKYRLT